MIDAKLLNILCCPETHQPLHMADAALVQSLNQQITAGTLKARNGHPVKTKLDSALIREDKKVIYPIIHKLPILLVEEGVILSS
ncbi:MAG TPA: Trm112 family protein [Verrucomicrobiae bacterium]